MVTLEQKFYSRCGSALDVVRRPRFPKPHMLTGLAYTLCRLLAAFVCLFSVNEAFGLSFSGSIGSAESAWRASGPDEQSDPAVPLQDAQEEREEREGECDDHDDEVDGSRHAGWASFRGPMGETRPPYHRWLIDSAPDKSHHSLDPKPPRRS